ncbi:MAG: NUDIX hydrolase [Lachnospiraceae bacterium]|nr:NUDIX hydrolase [Lachnospiraceae bacterium]
MNYIENMRKYIGHDMLLGVGCGVLIENGKGEVLLQRRRDTGEWCVPGGGLEPMETYEEAAKREIKEEVGLEVYDLELFGLYSGENRLIKYPNKDVVYSVAVVFRTRNYKGTISQPDGEALEHRFFSRENIPDNLFKHDADQILDWAKNPDKVVVR